jgi:hypothetical protein
MSQRSAPLPKPIVASISFGVLSTPRLVRVPGFERKISNERGEAKDQGGLPAGEIRRVAQQLVDGLAPNPPREFLDLVGGASNQTGQLRSVFTEVVSGAFGRIGDVAGWVGAAQQLIQKAFCLLIGIAAGDDAVCFAWLPACCATSASLATDSPAFSLKSDDLPNRLSVAPARLNRQNRFQTPFQGPNFFGRALH